MNDPGSTSQMPAVKADASKGSSLVLGLVLFLASPLLVAGALNAPLLSFNGVEEFAALKQAAQNGPSATPLADAVLRLQMAVLGENPALLRLVNLLFHFGTALLLYRILKAVMPVSGRNIVGPGFSIIPSYHPTKIHLAAGLAAAWFFFHPTNVETVAWASQRAGAQALFFAALAWWALLRPAEGAALGPFLQPPNFGRMLLALAAFAAAIFSHPVAAGFTVLFVLGELAWVRGPLGGRLLRALLLLGTGAVAGAKVVIAQQEVLGHASLAQLLAAAGHALSTTLVPWPLNFYQAVEPASSFAHPAVLTALFVLAAIVAIALWLPLHGNRLWVLLPGWLAVLGLQLWLGHSQQLFQAHYLYLALPMAAALVALGIEGLQYRCVFAPEAAQLGIRRASFALGVAACGFLGWLALGRSAVFADSLILVRDAADRQPESYFANCGAAQELVYRAEANLEKAPGEAKVDLQDAAVYLKQARASLDRDLAPNPAALAFLEARIAYALKAPDARDKLLTVAVLNDERIRDERVQALAMLAELDREQHKASGDKALLERARGSLAQAVQLHPRNVTMRLEYAEVLEALDQKKEAALQWKALSGEESVSARAKEALKRLEPAVAVAQTAKPVELPAIESDPNKLPVPAGPLKPSEVKVALVIMLKEKGVAKTSPVLTSLLSSDLKDGSNGSFAFGTWQCNSADATFTADVKDGDAALKISGVFRKRNDRLRAFILRESRN